MKVIIIGSGIAGVTFAEKLRELAVDASITILTQEKEGYYSRPLLSKGFSQDDIEQSIIIKSFDQILEQNICVISGVEVTSINCDKKQVMINGVDEVESLSYDKLILAMGSSAFIPPPYVSYQDNFFLFNSLIDLKQLRRLRQSILDENRQPDWAIIGGGLIGCEIASDLALAGDKVTLFHVMDRLMERQLVEEDSATLLQVLRDSSVDVRLNQTINRIEKQGLKRLVDSAGQQTEHDAVIVSCGFKPRTALAVNAGLTVQRGIKVRQNFQTDDENVFALGDVAELPNGKIYAFIKPIRHQALWLANYLIKPDDSQWTPPDFNPFAKVNHFKAVHPYLF